MAIERDQPVIEGLLRREGAKTSDEIYAQYGAPHYSVYNQDESEEEEYDSDAFYNKFGYGEGEYEEQSDSNSDTSQVESGEESGSEDGIPHSRLRD
jgi:hypothetical protein